MNEEEEKESEDWRNKVATDIPTYNPDLDENGKQKN
jgi:hypothetical protein